MDSGQHELIQFMVQAAYLMRSEYERIHARAAQDPGTAGDEGEENWREFLSGWLPPAYHVVTKGQLISIDGQLSPQVDIVVLHPTYPRRLIGVKKYLADLVIAAFECKLTLRRQDIKKALENAKAIRRLLKPRTGSLYKEVYSPLIYGLLAHSHAWTPHTETSAFNIGNALYDLDEQIIEHPREMLDFVCVSDLVTVPRSTHSYFDVKDGNFLTVYNLLISRQWIPDETKVVDKSQPIAQMLTALLRRLAREDPSVARLSSYFQEAKVGGAAGGGRGRLWNLSVLSTEALEDFVRRRTQPDQGAVRPDEWNLIIG